MILDGWGYSPSSENNAIAMAHTPNWDYFISEYPNTLLGTSGPSVGLPEGQMGNSEVGHLTIGSGRIIEQDFTRVEKDIKSREFYKNSTLCNALDKANKNLKAVHILGLLSDGGVHSHQDHIHAVLALAKQKECKEVYVHVFTDGRDTPPNSAIEFIELLESKINTLQTGRIVSIVGRFYAMDRDNRWDRVAKAYKLIASGKGDRKAVSAKNAIQMAYAEGETDEFIAPTTIGDHISVKEGDTIIFMNYRADRTRELTQALALPKFKGFERDSFKSSNFICLTEYNKDFSLESAYPPVKVKNTLGFYLSSLGFKQLRIAETEKYAHAVSYTHLRAHET